MSTQNTGTSSLPTLFLSDAEKDKQLDGLTNAVVNAVEFYCDRNNLTHNEDINDRPYRLKVSITLEAL